MFCPNCGAQNNDGGMFCSKCGMRLENADQTPQPINNQMEQQPQQSASMQSSNNIEQPNQTYINKAVNPNMKIWAILSIVIPIIGLIWYWFIGLSFYIAILIAAAGFVFAQKGEMASKKMAIAGKILNGILAGMAIVMLILQLILIFGNK